MASFLPLVFAALFAVAESATVVYVHSPDAQYTNANAGNAVLQSQSLAAAAHALLSTDPNFMVSPQASKQVEQVVGSDLFNRPQVLLAVQLLGVEHGEGVHKYLENIGSVNNFPFVGGAEALLQSVATVTKSGTISHIPPDYQAWQHCVDACTQEELQVLSSAFGGNYSSETGKVDLAVDGKKIQLDLAKAADRLWAVELGNFVTFMKTKAGLEAIRAQREATLIESSLVGMQAIGAEYGKESEQYSTALHTSLQQLQLAFSRVSGAYDGKAVLQLALLDHVPIDRLYELVNWRTEQARRSLFVRQLDEVPESTAAEWSIGASAVLTFIVILFAMLGGIYCLMYMKYKQDTLLYMRPKAD